ncbi:MAG: DUF1934 domain-containing protein [Bacilli bacterium]|nr:DUF1934 domain-containing protein [Bacilli bacterium]
MSKIKIKSVIKSKETVHIFEGKGIKQNNKITYNDNGILTTLTLGDTIYLERKKDYYMRLGFCINKNIKGTYIIPEGQILIETTTKSIKQEENSIIIRYFLNIDNAEKNEFELNLQYSIDTQ